MSNKEIIALYTKKKDCCGCGACMNICPKAAITMEKDKYGFIYPGINRELCVQCGACKNVCAFQNTTIQKSPEKIYAVAGKADELVSKSSSGGVFSVLAESVLESGGCVCGAVMLKEEGKSDDKRQWKVRHVICESKEYLYMLQGSKYVQSSMGTVFKDIRERLKHGQMVLFSGTPCQSDALKAFLKHAYENLIIVDIVCHGVPSEQFFNDYVKNLEKEIGGEIIDFKFRDKSSGWGSKTAKIRYIDTNKNICQRSISQSVSSYYSLFMESQICRENCRRCKYACKERVGDITIGDYWGIEEAHPEQLKQSGGALSEEKGVSVMLLNTEKGLRFFETVQNEFYYCESVFEKASKYNTQLVHPANSVKARRVVLELYRIWGYCAVERYFEIYVKAKAIKRKLRSMKISDDNK